MLSQFTEWLLGIITKVFVAHWDILNDISVFVFTALLVAMGEVFAAIPVPDFVTTGMQGLFGGVGGDIIWILGSAGLPQALAIYGSGFTFRLVRKAATLFQW